VFCLLLRTFFDLTEGLFKDVKVHFKGVNPNGRSYIIAEEAIYQFFNWERMPWEEWKRSRAISCSASQVIEHRQQFLNANG